VRQRVISAIFFIFLIAALPAKLSASTPDWVRNLAQQPAKHYPDNVDAVKLLDEQETTVRDSGEIIAHQRVVYRILRPEGKDYATHDLVYDSETKVNYLHGWSITAKGQEYEGKDKDTFERNLSSYDVFSDIKERMLALPGGDVGTIVAFEYEQKKRPYLYHDRWSFQTIIPVERTTYTLHLPSNWEFRAGWEHHPEVQPAVQNGTYSWQLSDVPRIELETHEPPYRALAGYMIVTFFSEKIHNSYSSWADIGKWYSQLTADSRQPTPALQQKVQELAPGNLSPLARIEALARFAQRDIRYASIKMGIGGFKPHAAGEIFAHRYGDCKDKANVLAAMLAQININSFYMPIHDDRGIFTQDSPPNHLFNHVILAIQLPDAIKESFPAVFTHPKLGRLLIFDPTNEFVPFGQLPAYEQDSYALLVTENSGELIHLPASPPEVNELRRSAKLKLLPDGSLQGEVEEVRSGYLAMTERMYLEQETERDRKKMMEHFLGATIGNFQVDGFEFINENNIDKDLVLKYKFTANHYAKNAGQLLLVRPRILGEDVSRFDGSKPRHYPYEFEAPFLASDSVEITLPDGFKVDELPDPAKANFPFAQYTSKTEAAGNVLKYTREYKMMTTLVPVDHIDQLRRLFSEIMTDEKNMAVLKKGN
jgi:hypothetical protein